MKQKIRSIPGKIFLFLAALLFACITTACAVGAFVMFANDFYEYSEEELMISCTEGRVQNIAYELMDGLHDTVKNVSTALGNSVVLELASEEEDSEVLCYAYKIAGNGQADLANGTAKATSKAESDKAAFDDYVDAVGIDDIQHTSLRYAVFDKNDTVYLQSSGLDLKADSPQWTYKYDVRLMQDQWSDADAEAEPVYYIDLVPDNIAADASGRQDFTAGTPGTHFIFCAYIDPESKANDFYTTMSTTIRLLYPLRYTVYPVAIVSLLLFVLSFTALLCVSGRRPGDDKPHKGPLGNVPFDLLFLAACCVIPLDSYIAEEISYRSTTVPLLILVCLCTVLTISVVIGLCMSIAGRVKAHMLLKNTVIWRVCKLARRILQKLWSLCKRVGHLLKDLFLQIPMVWKTVLVVGGISLLEIFLMMACWWDMEVYLVFWVLEHLVLIPLILRVSISLRKLHLGGRALAAGKLDYQVDTRHMFWDLKEHGENLNHIGVGMTTAVEERLQSERMKTELITNVSHDIKTPLTSIINYADLISKEDCENPRIQEYTEVLSRQSDRLKRLIEDLVEASKTSTGNLEMALAPCDAAVFLSQTAGEYEEKLAAANLTLVTKVSAQDARILADGRRMLRIFDNLMNNVYKYAQPGTRVYLSLEADEKDAIITFRNTSRSELNISAEELMERFVRGDASRSTEGNGLGLSIARSLTELQNGTFRLSIDGDLFKVTLHFPLILFE